MPNLEGRCVRPRLTRRQAIGVSVAALTGLSMPSRVSRPAIASEALTHVMGDVTVLRDGTLTLPMSFYLPDQSADQIASVLSPHGLPLDAVRPDCNLTLLRRGDRLVLFDAGAGPLFQDTAGKLIDSLDQAGIDPAEVTDIVFTHAHPDHLWGVLDDFDDLLFANARYWMNRNEWDFWRAPGTLNAMPEARKSFVVGAQNRMAAIEEQISLFDAGAEILPGVEAVATVGHTPGHTSFMVHGGDEPILVVGDAIANAVISFERADWRMGTDQDPELAVQTRQRLLDRLAGDRARMIGFHLPFPGIGTVERVANRYRFVATS